jgi:2-methylisocitrate lyase-like PEP mutase family enzyme
VDRIRAAREAIARSGHDVMLVGRSEGYLIGRTELTSTIDRLVAYADAGADCLYAPGMTDVSAIRDLVAAVAPKPVNVLLIGPKMRVADLAAAGVRRVSVGGALAAAAWAAFDRAVQLFTDEGTLPKREIENR